MNVGGVEAPPAVYLSPQAISPLSASKQPIALSITVPPPAPDESQRADAAKAGEKNASRTIDKIQEPKAPALVAASAAGSAYHGRVDLYV